MKQFKTKIKKTKNMLSKKTKIIVKHGQKKELLALFDCSHVTVTKALSNKYRETSLIQLQIRKKALELGGLEIEIE